MSELNVTLYHFDSVIIEWRYGSKFTSQVSRGRAGMMSFAYIALRNSYIASRPRTTPGSPAKSERVCYVFKRGGHSYFLEV